jgi:hypothetical protein
MTDFQLTDDLCDETKAAWFRADNAIPADSKDHHVSDAVVQVLKTRPAIQPQTV